MASFYVLGLDPGFASIGFAVVKIDGSGSLPVEMGVIRTQKSDAKRKVRASEDNLERAKEIASELQRLIKAFSIRVICAETMSFPRNAGSAAKMSICWGVLAAIAQQYDLPLVQASPQEIKKALCNKKDASKEEVQAALRERFANLRGDMTENENSYILRYVPASQREHPNDALAAVVACESSEVMLFARRMAACEASTA